MGPARRLPDRSPCAITRIPLAQRVGGSSPIGQGRRAVGEGIGAVERFFKGLGR